MKSKHEAAEEISIRKENETEAYDCFLAGIDFAESWIDVNEDLPHAYESGNWDGLRSDLCLVEFKDGSLDFARIYKGQMDGFEFCDWYDKMDFDFGTSVIVKWRPINRP